MKMFHSYCSIGCAYLLQKLPGKITFTKLNMQTKKKRQIFAFGYFRGLNENATFLLAKTMHINTTMAIIG